jgi:hypothetical protein
MKLHFDAALVQRLLDHSQQSATRNATFEQLFMSKYRKDGRDIDVTTIVGGALPSCDDIDPTRLEPGLWLVGDQGVYLMSNGTPRLLPDPARIRHDIAMAEETDSTRHPDTWWDVKCAAFGGDDGVILLSRDFVAALLSAGRAGRVCIDLTPRRAIVTTPRPVAHQRRPSARLPGQRP